VTGVEVEWIQLAPFVNSDRKLTAPPTILDKGQLSELELVGTPCFESVQLNSVRIMELDKNDEATDYECWFNKFCYRFKGTVQPKMKHYKADDLSHLVVKFKQIV